MVVLRYDPEEPRRARLAVPPGLEPIDTPDLLRLAVASAVIAAAMLPAAVLSALGMLVSV